MTSSTVSDCVARKSLTLALQALQDPGTQAAIAKAMQCSESTISRLKTDHFGQLCEVLALAGLKVVPSTDVTIDPERIKALCLLLGSQMLTVDSLTKMVLGDKE